MTTFPLRTHTLAQAEEELTGAMLRHEAALRLAMETLPRDCFRSEGGAL